MSSRKLQQEIDKANKKISEGLVVFFDILDKLQTSDIQSQREKLESDLKKEIKKLQRSRDQLKQWLADTSIKLDKSQIQENRSRIEHAMDKFKELEKLLKIKQFLNEGLELQSLKRLHKFNDPEDAKKHEAADYISDMIDKLNQQTEALDSELHLLQLQLKKSKSAALVQTSIDEVKARSNRNADHVSRLEQVLRNLENDRLDPARVDDIKDDLEHYVDHNQDDEYFGYDDFYDVLELNDDDFDASFTQSNGDDETHEYRDTENGLESASRPSTKPESPRPVSSVPIAKKKASVVPAANPPPFAGSGLYLSVAKAAVSKAPPPGLNPGLKSSTASPQAQLSHLNDDLQKRAVAQNAFQTLGTSPGQMSAPQSQLPPAVSNEGKTFWDTIPRLSSIPQSRLQNPLPFQSISLLLELSLLNCPDLFDAEKPRQYNPVNIHPSSVDYPQEPMYELNLSAFMRKFDNDTLFFCFYYSDAVDNLAKWNASRELSRRNWVFNTELKQWLSREDKPKGRSMLMVQKEEEASESSDDDKEENYKYFDYERTWLTRRKEKFRFPSELRETF